MNVRSRSGLIHHLVEETGRLLCGQSEAPFDERGNATGAAVNCPACVRMLADDVRRGGPRVHDSED